MNEVILQTQANRGHLLKELCKRPESITNLLPYADYLQDEEIFVFKDATLGAGYELTLIEHETLPIEQIKELTDSFHIFLDLPKNIIPQIIFTQDYIAESHELFAKRELQTGELIGEMLDSERLKDLGENRPLIRRAYIFLHYIPQFNLKRSLQLFTKGQNSIIDREFAGHQKDVEQFQNILSTLKAKTAIPIKRLDADDLLEYLRAFFNPISFKSKSYPTYKGHLSLSNQIVYTDTVVGHSGFVSEGITTKTLSIKNYPSRVYVGQMASMLSKISFPFKMCLNLYLQDDKKIKTILNWRGSFLAALQNQTRQRQAKDLDAVDKAMAYGQSLVDMGMHLIISHQSQDKLKWMFHELEGAFKNTLNCDVMEEQIISMGLLLNCLPFNFDPDSNKFTRRNIKIIDNDLAYYFPFFDSYRGFAFLKSYELLRSRENNLACFSLSNCRNKHTVVIGDTGTGKSFKIISSLINLKINDPNVQIFHLDYKEASANMATFLGGRCIKFDSETPPFSPFAGYYDGRKITSLTQILLFAIKLYNTDFIERSEHEMLLTEAIIDAYNEKIDSAQFEYRDGEVVTIEDIDNTKLSNLTLEEVIIKLESIAKERKNLAVMAEDIIVKLSPFYGNGPRASIFNNNQVCSNKFDINIYDLDGLNSEPKMKSLITLAVIEEIRQTIRLKKQKNPDAWGFIVFEEIGTLGDNEIAAKFVKESAETFRKIGFFLIGLSPNPLNFVNTKAGKALLNAADQYLFFPLGKQKIDVMIDGMSGVHASLQTSLFTPAIVQILESLRTIGGQYSDFFYTDKDGERQGVFRFSPTATDYWIALGNDKAKTLYDKMLQKFKGDKWKTLQYLIEHFPKGVL